MPAKEKGAQIAGEAAEGCTKGCLLSLGEVFDVFTLEPIWRYWKHKSKEAGHPFRAAFAGAMEESRLFRGFILTGGIYGVIRLCDLTASYAP